jgi:hypothetical protein
MSLMTSFILANFFQPEKIGVDPQSMLWILPLVAAISIVYKTTKIQNIKFFSFTKEVVVLFGSIIIFMIIIAVVLYGIVWLLLE